MIGVDLETIVAFSKVYPDLIPDPYVVRDDSKIIEAKVRRDYPGKSESFYQIQLRFRVLNKIRAGYYKKVET